MTNIYLFVAVLFLATACQTPKEYPLNGVVCLEMYENKDHEYWKHPTLKELCLAMIQQAKVDAEFSDDYPNENIPVNATDDGTSNLSPQLNIEEGEN